MKSIPGWLLLFLLWLCAATPSSAHQLGVDSVVLEELGDHLYRISYVASPGATEAQSLPILPAHCQWSEEAEGAPSGALGLTFSSGHEALGAEDVILLPWKRNGVLVTAVWQGGAQARQFFMSSPEGIRVELALLKASSGSFGRTFQRFAVLGAEHILKGFDHLLFVLGLLLLVHGFRDLTHTITAFTIAHSITLALSVFGQVRFAPDLVNALVALSIVFLAVEILKAQQGRAGLTRRYPWCVSFGFGLVHGLGFAGTLNALGLPAADIPAALLSFNLGVELGQLLIVALWLLATWAARELSLPWSRQLVRSAAYALGIVATYWFIDLSQAILRP